MNQNIIKIEIEGLKAGVMHMLSDRNDGINEQIKKTIDQTMTEKWVVNSIKLSVDEAIKKAIESFSDDYQVKDAIKSCIGQVVIDALKQSNIREERPNRSES